MMVACGVQAADGPLSKRIPDIEQQLKEIIERETGAPPRALRFGGLMHPQSSPESQAKKAQTDLVCHKLGGESFELAGKF